MSGIVWWFGAIHLAAYAIVGLFAVLTLLTVKAHMMAKVMGRIIQWHQARTRWDRRHQQGLTDAEWQRGEPKP